MKCTDCGQEISPVVALDIDGTLGDYHCHFVEFAEKYLDARLPRDYDGGGEFSEYLNLDKEVYRRIKLAYRQGAQKRTMRRMTDALEFTQELRQLGCEIWIATTRPWASLDSIDPDTKFWLEKHKFEYDYVVFGERKYNELVKRVDANRVVAVVDDLEEHLYDAERGWGWDAFCPANPHTLGVRWENKLGFPRIAELIKDSISEWRQG